MRQIGEHAVVLGAGIAGLMAARVLVEAYDRVTVVERDVLRTSGDGRRGVPQGRHAHALLPRGGDIVGDLFPGIVQELVDDGAVVAEPLVDFRLSAAGHTLRKVPIGATALQCSRPFLEDHIRNRVTALPGVTLTDGCDVVGLTVEGDRRRVTGVRIVRRQPGSAEEELAAGLVVDAMGRGGRTPAWLQALGYPRPREEEFRVGVAYASRLLRLPPDAAGVEKAVGTGPVPGRPRGMMMLAIEDECRLLTLAGFDGTHRPPSDEDGFLAFAATVAPPDVFAAVRDAEPLGGIATYRYPSYLRRHYQEMSSFPDGLLVIGDALCSFSPIYAQGMTVAALQAVALRDSLGRGPAGLARRYFRAAARVTDDPWQMATGADLALPEVDGPRPLRVRVMNAYAARIQAAAATDATVARQFMRVTGLLDPPSRMLRPGFLWRVLRRRATPDLVRTPAGARPDQPATEDRGPATGAGVR
ncbi:MAG TPA: FAD-binding monooxygenase [Pilimelia sp.]|nr:FAD-binding monooxygenase [Pilimelia sp.]